MDAVTAYVLKVIIYTGKYTYNESADQKKKKTVQIVKQLLEHLAGTHRTVYINQFYTSAELLKELREMDLYVTGTLMKNQIPKELQIAKNSNVYKKMKRGDFERHLLVYKSKGVVQHAGLVCWKDRDIVYCMLNETNTTETDVCQRRTKDGLITLTRPKIVSEYNKYMGGIDLADMWRLHCNSTIMEQNQ